MKHYFILAFKNLRRRGIRSWLTLLGIFIGIAAVVSLISLGNSLQYAVISQFPIETTEIITVSPGGLNQFGPIGTAGAAPLKQSDVDAIERLGGVEVVFGRNIQNAFIDFNSIQNLRTVANSPMGQKRNYLEDYFGLKIDRGRMLRDDDFNGVVLGSSFSNSERNGFEREIRIGDRLKINEREFRVVGILERMGSFIFDRGIIMNEDSMQRLFDFEDEVDMITVKVKDKKEIPKISEEIERLMRQRRRVKEGEEDFQVSTPEAMLSTVNQVLFGVQVFIAIVASLSILVGAIGISNTMTTSVLERKKEIGIMKAIGAKNKDVFYQFFIEAGLLGFIGGMIGILVGLGAGYLGVYSIKEFLGVSTKMTINYFLISFALIGSFLIGSLSGIIPALNAAKQNPVDALMER